MNRKFESYIGIDYSGAGHSKTRTGSLQVYQAKKDLHPVPVLSPSATRSKPRNWNRFEIFEWLYDYLSNNQRTMVAIDHGFSFPQSYYQRYRLKSWDQFLVDFVSHWPTHHDNLTVNDLRTASKRIGSNSEFRLTEKWTSSAKSVFQFDVQGSVAKSTHCGIPLLAKLRTAMPSLHCWPFDGFEIKGSKSVIAETYPSLFRNRYARGSRTVDQQDAFSVCKWLQETDRGFGLDRYFHLPLTESEKATVKLEGWILGVC